MSDNIKVVVKVRPLISREIEDKLSYQWRVKNNTLYQLDNNGRDLGPSFTFDKVFDKDSKTSDVYNDIAKPIVEAAMAGFNGTIFAYGQTSSGKTYTMTGTEDSPGIIPLAVFNLFESIKNIPDRDFLVRVSYIEIYNETLRDLLDIKKINIKVHENFAGVKVDCKEIVTTSPEEVLKFLKEGEANRQTGATNMNEESSRSHSIFQITIESREHIEGEEEVGCVNVSTLNLVDLAGSERAGQTGAVGIRFREGTHINKSLSSLALVIKQLSEDQTKHVNYRDSKLTRILQNSLGGNAKTSIICAITPAAVEETISTLQFANRAKAIKNKPEVNAVATDATMIQSLTKQLSKLQSQLESKKNLEVMLESKKNVEQDNNKLQKQIAALQKLILNGFGSRSSIDMMGTRRKLVPPRRITISTLHSIDEDPVPLMPKYQTPLLKYNPMSLPGANDFVPIQSTSRLPRVSEGSENRLITPPPLDKKGSTDDDEIIELDSDDETSPSEVQTCSPYHKCYRSLKTPPCVLRKNAKLAEKNLKDIVELTEREKMYTPSVVELIEKLEQNASVITGLQDEVNALNKKGRDKDLEIDQLRVKISKSSEEIKTVNTTKAELEALCKEYTTKLTDWEVSYETLKNKAKRREQELLSLLEEQKLLTATKKVDDFTSKPIIAKNIDKELNFMDMSKDISLVNSDNESSIANTNDDESCSQFQDLVTDMQNQLKIRNETVLKLEDDLMSQKEAITSLESSSYQLQNTIDNLKEKVDLLENENSLLKSTVDTLNSTIKNQKSNLETAHNDIESYNSLIQELQIKLTNKEKILNFDINDGTIENMIANEEKFLANHDNMKNIIHCFKMALEARNKEIKSLKSAATDGSRDHNAIKEQLFIKDNEITSLNDKIKHLQDQINYNETVIEKLVQDKTNITDMERQHRNKISDLSEQNNKLEQINEENVAILNSLEESKKKLTDIVTEKQKIEEELTRKNEELVGKLNEFHVKINNLELDLSAKDVILKSLNEEDKISQEYVEKAKTILEMVQNSLAKFSPSTDCTDDIGDVFDILQNKFANFESRVTEIIASKELDINNSNQLNLDLERVKLELTTETDDLKLKIKHVTEDLDRSKNLLAQITEEYDEMTQKLETKNTEIVELNSILGNSKTALEKVHCDLLNVQKSNTIIEQNDKQLDKQIEKLTSTLEAIDKVINEKDNTILDLKKDIVKKSDEVEGLSKKLQESIDCESLRLNCIFERVSELAESLNIDADFTYNDDISLYENILQRLENISMYVKHIECQKSKASLEDFITEAKKEIASLTEHNSSLTEKLSDAELSNNRLLSELEEIKSQNKCLNYDLTEGNKTLELLRSELKEKATDIEIMVTKTQDLKEQFIGFDCVMKDQIKELLSYNEILTNDNDILKMRCTELESINKDEANSVSSKEDIYQIDSRTVTLSRCDVTSQTNITENRSPKSLLTICCNKIVDALQPSENSTSTTNSEISIPYKETESKTCNCDELSSELKFARSELKKLTDVIDEQKFEIQGLIQEREAGRPYKETDSKTCNCDELSSELNFARSELKKLTDVIDEQKFEIQGLIQEREAGRPYKETESKTCNCDELSSELKFARSELKKLTDVIDEQKFEIQGLIQEREAVRQEVQLLLEPAYELQKKINSHKTNLSTLTATTYAENKSLKSQVTVLQHHHSRFHHVCQRDLPVVKKQLCELMAILKSDNSYLDKHNASFKRYSLPSVFDNDATLNTLKNESTLDGDLLMLDTNLTLATSSDSTLMGIDQTCLDLTQICSNKDVACQTDDVVSKNNIDLTDIAETSSEAILPNENKKILEQYTVLEQENEDLKKQLQQHAQICSKECITTSVQTSPVDIGVLSKECEECSSLIERIKGLEINIESLSQELADTKSLKKDFEEKYNNLILEVPSTEALIRKLKAFERDCKNKSDEILRLSNLFNAKQIEFKQLQQENDLLSTQVMENITETDDLAKQLEDLKKENIKMMERCSHMENLLKESENKENSAKLNCSRCHIRDEVINTVQNVDVHSKLNRSLSDSETSSRYNKICTLQNELHAGREDCKELTEEVATIKSHLERSNLSIGQNMDLDDSMGESNIFTFTKHFETVNSPLHNFSVSNAHRERQNDLYTLDKTDCFNYYVEKTGINKENLNVNMKIVDLMKMFYNDFLTKHSNEVENFVNKVKCYEEARNQLESHINEISSEYSKVKDLLKERDNSIKRVTDTLSQIKKNIAFIREEMSNDNNLDGKNMKLVTIFKEKLLKILDNGFELSSATVFEKLIDAVATKHQKDLNNITEQYTKLQQHMESLSSELNSVNENLLQMKGQLTDKENEYNLLKAQKERVHEISNAVTLDIIKKEKELSEAIFNGCKKLVELNIVSSGDIDMALPINKNIDLVFERIIADYKPCTSDSEKENLILEIKQSKTALEESQKALETIKVENNNLKQINQSVTLNLVDMEKQMQTQTCSIENLNKLLESKEEENESNIVKINKLTNDLKLIKESSTNIMSIITKLESETGVEVTELLNKIADYKLEISDLKTVNGVITKEKEACAIELETCKESLRKNKTELDNMTSDILVLRESVKENISVIENLKLEAKSLLKHNFDLKNELEEKCRDCSRLEMNIKTHEKTAEIQSKMIIRLQKQKGDDDSTIKEKNKQIEDLTKRYADLQKECEAMKNIINASKEEIEKLKKSKDSLELRQRDIDLDFVNVNKPRGSLEPDTTRRRRQSIHDAKRMYLDDCGDHSKIEAVFDSRPKPQDLFMDIDDDQRSSSDRSTPLRSSRGRDSLQSRHEQSDKDDDPARPSSVAATRRRRQSIHDMHRSGVMHTPTHERPSSTQNNSTDLKSSDIDNNNAQSEVIQLREQLASCQKELEDLKEQFREVDEECEICSQYLREREEQCSKLKKEKAALTSTINELQEKLQSGCQANGRLESKRDLIDATVNTDEDWANLHAVVVDRMSYDAEVEKNKRLTKTIEELRYKKQELKITLGKMQKALERNAARDHSKELEAAKSELRACKQELKELKEKYKELDLECETCSEYLREREEQCRKLKEAKAALEAKLQQYQENVSSKSQTVRKKRQSLHDQNRLPDAGLTDAATETSDDFLSYQVEQDDVTYTKELRRLKSTVDKLSKQKAALENQLISASSAPAPNPMYVATGSAIVQNQQITDVLRENYKLKKINTKLIEICKKRGKRPDLEDENSEQA